MRPVRAPWLWPLVLGSFAISGLSGCDVEPPPPSEGQKQLGETHDAATVCPGDSLVPGIDVSYYQGTIDWNAVAGSGIKFAITRLNDGSFDDPKFQENWDGIKAAGLVRGLYQFFEPGNDTEDQANLVVDTVGMLGAGDLPAMIDIEKAGSLSKAAYADEIQQWVDIVEAGTGKKPMIYTGKYFWQDNVGSADFKDYPLVHAAYPDACQPPNPPPGQGCESCPNLADQFDDWQFWQYTSTNHVPGIAGNVDTDVFNGTEADLALLAGGGHAAKLLSIDGPMVMTPGETVTVSVTYQNVGSAPWGPSTFLGTTGPRDRESMFHDDAWPTTNRAAGVANAVNPGDDYTFEVMLHAPPALGAYSESFGLVEEQVTWFADEGGPADDAVTLQLQVVSPPAPSTSGSAGSTGSGGAGGSPQGPDDSGCDCSVVATDPSTSTGRAPWLAFFVVLSSGLSAWCRRRGRTDCRS